MSGRWDSTERSAALLGASRAFRRVVERIEEARGTLLLGVPSGRAPRLPLAEALAGFEAGLAEARALMEAWRIPDAEPEWLACHAAIDASSGGAERLRLHGGPRAYEELAPVLEDLLDPLEAFDRAAQRFRALGL